MFSYVSSKNSKFLKSNQHTYRYHYHSHLFIILLLFYLTAINYSMFFIVILRPVGLIIKNCW